MISFLLGLILIVSVYSGIALFYTRSFIKKLYYVTRKVFLSGRSDLKTLNEVSNEIVLKYKTNKIIKSLLHPFAMFIYSVFTTSYVYVIGRKESPYLNELGAYLYFLFLFWSLLFYIMPKVAVYVTKEKVGYNKTIYPKFLAYSLRSFIENTILEKAGYSAASYEGIIKATFADILVSLLKATLRPIYESEIVSCSVEAKADQLRYIPIGGDKEEVRKAIILFKIYLKGFVSIVSVMSIRALSGTYIPKSILPTLTYTYSDTKVKGRI